MRNFDKLEQIKIEMNKASDRLRELDESEQEWEEAQDEIEVLKAKLIVLAQEFVDVYNVHEDIHSAKREGSRIILS